MNCPACGHDDSVIHIEADTGLHKNCRLTMRNIGCSASELRAALERTPVANIEPIGTTVDPTTSRFKTRLF